MRFQNDWRRRLATSEDEKQSLRDSMAKLDNANKTLELKLKHARTQLDTEIRKRKLAEQDMQRLVSIVLMLLVEHCWFHVRKILLFRSFLLVLGTTDITGSRVIMRQGKKRAVRRKRQAAFGTF